MVSAVDLHNIQLRIGRNANHITALQLISRSDAGNVGTVVAHGVVVMGDIQIVISIVKTENHLAVAVQVTDRDHFGVILRCLFIETGGRIKLIQHRGNRIGIGRGFRQFFLRQRLEMLMVNIQTGIDDGDLDTHAGIAAVPCLLAADQRAGGVGHQLTRRRTVDFGGTHLILRLQQHLLHAVNLFDLADQAVGYLGRHAVEQPCILIADIQALAFQHQTLNGGDHFCLAGGQIIHHRLGLGAVGSLAVGFDHRKVVHDDQNLDHLVIFDLLDLQICIQIIGKQIQIK